MPRVQYFECGGCGKKKGQDNHWFVVRTSHSSASLAFFHATPFVSENFDDHWDEIYCGAACLTKAFSRWVGHRIGASA